MPKARRFGGVSGRCVEEKSDKNSRVWRMWGRVVMVLGGGGGADMPSYAAFSVVWGGGDACKEWSCTRCQTFPPRNVSAPVKCKYVSAFRRFPPRSVNGVGVCKE